MYQGGTVNMNSLKDFSFDLIKNINIPEHLDTNLEIFYVIEGELRVTMRGEKFVIGKDELIATNSSVPHSAAGSEGCIVACISFSYRVVAQMLGERSGFFFCNSALGHETYYTDIKEVVQKLVYLNVVRDHSTESYKISYYYRLLDLLIENCMMDNAGTGGAKGTQEDDHRLDQMIRYVHLNYQDNISLNYLADEMFVSASTLSRFFRKQTGEYFADYVNRVRTNYAITDMIYTDKNITRIALDAGFSNASVFNKVFRERYGCSPTDFRNRKKQETAVREQEKKGIKREIEKGLTDRALVRENPVKANTVYSVDTGQSVTCKKIWNRAVNIGSLYDLTLANVQYHLLYLKEQLGLTHVRFWSVFSSRMSITDGKVAGVFNFSAVDSVLDFLVEHGIAPFFDIATRPDITLKSSGQPVYLESEEIEFSSPEVWKSLVREFVRHVVRRYGREETSKWVFEISMSLSYPGQKHIDLERYDPGYFDQYKFFSETIRREIPGAKIGGAGGISNLQAPAVRQFLKDCRRCDLPLDFVSFILFPYDPVKGTQGASFHRVIDNTFEAAQVRIMREIMREAGYEDKPLYITEWNCTLSNRNYLNDSCYRGTYFLRKLVDIMDQADLVIPWIASDWISTYLDSVDVVNGSGGLITRDGIRKPAYFAFEFLGRLGGQLVIKGPNYIVTKNDRDNFMVLLFNYSSFSANYYLRAENKMPADELNSVFSGDTDLVLNLELTGLQDHVKYIIKRREVNQDHGSILDEWGRFQYDRQLNRRDVKYLSEICVPHMGMEHLTVVGGKLRLQVKLGRHEFELLHIYKADM